MKVRLLRIGSVGILDAVKQLLNALLLCKLYTPFYDEVIILVFRRLIGYILLVNARKLGEL